MTLVLFGKGLLLKGSTTKIEDKQVPGIYIYLQNAILGRHTFFETKRNSRTKTEPSSLRFPPGGPLGNLARRAETMGFTRKPFQKPTKNGHILKESAFSKASFRISYSY